MARITEWGRLEGTTVAHLIRPPCSSRSLLSAVAIHGKLCSTFCPHTEFALDLTAVLHKKDKNNLVHGIRSHEFNVKTEKNQ